MTSGISTATLTGTVAALCTTLAVVPRLVTIRKEGSGELSSTTLYLLGLGLWLVYGVVESAPPVVVASAASLVIASGVTARKALAARPARRLRIAIDMDETMADSLSEHVGRYNAAFGANITAADLRGRHLEDWAPAAHRKAIGTMLDSSFFAHLAIMPDCQEVVRELSLEHDVYIVTAAMEVPASFDAKFQWLQQHFPFVPPSQIVFCGDKGVIDADYLIDDSARHFMQFRGQGLLFSAPHNISETRYPRVSSWQEVRDVFSRMRALGGRLPSSGTSAA